MSTLIIDSTLAVPNLASRQVRLSKQAVRVTPIQSWVCVCVCLRQGVRWMSGVGARLVIRRLRDRLATKPNNVVSFGKALHPTCLEGNVPVL